MPDGSGEATKGASAPSGDIVALRILATTDMHMNVLPYDYLADRPSGRGGLARTASLIARRRAEVDNCLLLDNGDFLEGTPLGDFAARRTAGMDRPHPAIAAMNALAYDAAALGNHDFSFGLAFLRGATDRARFPVLAANLHVRRGRGFAPYAIVDRSLRDVAGRQVPMRIGLVGFLPPQTAEWDRDLSSDLICDDIVATAGRIVPQMRRAGAQIVIALAHTGIGDPAARPGMENAATALAATPGIDAVIAGHTHQVFPGRDFRAIPGIDPQRGTLAGKPAVMAGFGGSHLGVIDLRLRRDGAGGFCYLNNAAIAAEALRTKFERVAILDPDMHHGQGIQEIFYERDDVLYISIHGDPTNFYPVVTGHEDERGAGPGYGYNINLPMPHGSPEETFFEKLDEAVAAIRLFSADVLVLPLGFDIYKDDPQAKVAVSSEGFARIGQAMAGLDMPVCVIQEGGYDIDSLEENARQFFTGLLDR